MLSCGTCQAFLCSECSSLIHILGIYKNHLQVPIKISKIGDLVSCEYHGQNLTYFCTEDWKAICETCLDTHSSHPVLKIDEAAAETLFEIKSKKNKLFRMRKKLVYELNDAEILEPDIEYAKKEAVSKAKDAFKQIRRAIQIKEEEIIEEINSCNEKKKQLINVCKEEINSKLENIDVVLKMIEAATEIPKGAMLESLKYLSKMIDLSLTCTDTDISSIDTSYPALDTQAIFNGLNFTSVLEPTNIQHYSPTYTSRKLSDSLNSPKISSQSLSKSSNNPFSFAKSLAIPNSASKSDDQEPRKFTLKHQSSSDIKLS